MVEVDVLQAAFAALPIVIVLILMLGFRLSAAIAGAAGLGCSLVLAFTAFRPETSSTSLSEGPLGLGHLLGGAGIEAGFTALTILWIIFGALCLFQLQQRTGALDLLRSAIGSLSDDPRIVAILIAWFFALFAEGAAGFGTAVALAAPFLVGFGFAPVQAVIITLIGHSVGVSFGAVGTPIVAQAQLVTFKGLELGFAAAQIHVLLGWIMLVALLRVVIRDPSQSDTDPRGPRAKTTGSIWLWAAVAAIAYLVPMYGIARFVGPELPTLGASLVGGVIFVAVFALVQRTAEASSEKDPGSSPKATAILRAASPYLVVIVLVLITRLIKPIAEGLPNWSWALWGQFKGGFNPLLHPGTLLMAGFFIGGWINRASWVDFSGSMRDALRKLGPVTIALLAMLGLSRVMVHTGMIDALAAWTAATTASTWPFFSPWVGVLGTFVTGSSTASNILFSEFQYATTVRLGMPPLTLLGAQSFGAAVGNIICPHNIVAGGATVGISGEEGRILAQTIGACLIYATFGGLIALVFVYGG